MKTVTRKQLEKARSCLASTSTVVTWACQDWNARHYMSACSTWSPDEAKVHGGVLIRQGPVGFGTAQRIAGTVWPALFSLLKLLILLVVLVSFCQSCMGQMCSFLENPFFFLEYFLPKFFGNWCFSGFLSGDDSCRFGPWELFWFSPDRIGGSSPLFL